MKRHSGFTLIEMLIVIAIILIISAITIPSLTGAKMNANETSAEGPFGRSARWKSHIRRHTGDMRRPWRTWEEPIPARNRPNPHAYWTRA